MMSEQGSTPRSKTSTLDYFHLGVLATRDAGPDRRKLSP